MSEQTAEDTAAATQPVPDSEKKQPARRGRVIAGGTSAGVSALAGIGHLFGLIPSLLILGGTAAAGGGYLLWRAVGKPKLASRRRSARMARVYRPPGRRSSATGRRSGRGGLSGLGRKGRSRPGRNPGGSRGRGAGRRSGGRALKAAAGRGRKAGRTQVSSGQPGKRRSRLLHPLAAVRSARAARKQRRGGQTSGRRPGPASRRPGRPPRTPFSRFRKRMTARKQARTARKQGRKTAAAKRPRGRIRRTAAAIGAAPFGLVRKLTRRRKAKATPPAAAVSLAKEPKPAPRPAEPAPQTAPAERRPETTSPSRRKSVSANVDAAVEGISQHIGNWEPQTPVDLDEFLSSIPQLFESLSTSLAGVADKLGEQFPVEPSVTESLREMAAHVSGLTDTAGEAHTVHRSAHEQEMHRIENPRVNEQFWDVSSSS